MSRQEDLRTTRALRQTRQGLLDLQQKNVLFKKRKEDNTMIRLQISLSFQKEGGIVYVIKFSDKIHVRKLRKKSKKKSLPEEVTYKQIARKKASEPLTESSISWQKTNLSLSSLLPKHAMLKT